MYVPAGSCKGLLFPVRISLYGAVPPVVFKTILPFDSSLHKTLDIKGLAVS